MTVLERLEQLRTEATPGPWKWLEYRDKNGDPRPRMFLEAVGQSYGHVLKITWPELLKDADAKLIAQAVNALPALLRIARAAEKLDVPHKTVWGYDARRPDIRRSVCANDCPACLLRSALSDLEANT